VKVEALYYSFGDDDGFVISEPVAAGILRARRVPMTTRIGERRAPLEQADLIDRIAAGRLRAARVRG
jgi:hypothetical protein